MNLSSCILTEQKAVGRKYH